MGCCTSFTETSTDPYTGKQTTKTSLGGAYPGQRRQNNSPYKPDASAFDGNGQATAHFKAIGGGNALTLVQQDGTTPVPMITAPQYIQVTIPPGVAPGQLIHVQAPDGAVNAITVPEGYGPGSTFTVEFAAPTDNETKHTEAKQDKIASPPTAPAETGDDGFASGFGAPPLAAATTNFSDEYYAQYGTSSQQQATPVYPKY